jgi:uncharacterized membrane protein YphA (DoxX/SURF4 family)
MQIKKIIVNICRILVGVLFIFSGFIKANDPLGFSYKLDEYFQVFHIEKFFPDPMSAYLSIIICTFEMFVGVCLLLGVFRNFTAWMLLIMIVFFSFLTFYSAQYHKVTDCGCFGDAIHLRPWQSFSKDMILLVLILPIFFMRSQINSLLPDRLGRIVAFFALLISLMFTIYTYYYLPVIDFRPYAIGKDIEQQMSLPPGSPKDSILMTFIYRDKKTGKDLELTSDQISHMDSIAQDNLAKNDTFVERKDIVIREGAKPPIHDFAIAKNDSDVTKQFLSEKGYRIMITQYDVEKSSVKFQKELNKLMRQVIKDKKAKIWALSGSSSALNEAYRQAHNVPYEYYSADVTMLKTITRSNPGLVLLHNNVVVKKWPATALPNIETLYSYMK